MKICISWDHIKNARIAKLPYPNCNVRLVGHVTWLMYVGMSGRAAELVGLSPHFGLFTSPYMWRKCFPTWIIQVKYIFQYRHFLWYWPASPAKQLSVPAPDMQHWRGGGVIGSGFHIWLFLVGNSSHLGPWVHLRGRINRLEVHLRGRINRLGTLSASQR